MRDWSAEPVPGEYGKGEVMSQPAASTQITRRAIRADRLSINPDVWNADLLNVLNQPDRSSGQEVRRRLEPESGAGLRILLAVISRLFASGFYVCRQTGNLRGAPAAQTELLFRVHPSHVRLCR